VTDFRNTPLAVVDLELGDDPVADVTAVAALAPDAAAPRDVARSVEVHGIKGIVAGELGVVEELAEGIEADAVYSVAPLAAVDLEVGEGNGRRRRRRRAVRQVLAAIIVVAHDGAHLACSRVGRLGWPAGSCNGSRGLSRVCTAVVGSHPRGCRIGECRPGAYAISRIDALARILILVLAVDKVGREARRFSDGWGAIAYATRCRDAGRSPWATVTLRGSCVGETPLSRRPSEGWRCCNGDGAREVGRRTGGVRNTIEARAQSATVCGAERTRLTRSELHLWRLRTA
jgi:hypothetical protein